MRSLKTAGTVLLWGLQILGSLVFVMAGVGKFRSPFWIAAFARWGYPGGFRVVIGVLEIACGVLLASPRTASYAATLVGCIMIGAAGTLILHNEAAFTPIFWCAALALIGIGRRHRAWRPRARGISPTPDSV